ncbi:MAG: DUF1080 domain-containing protein [Fuerstiella sp.]|nr:DUF1080 domain-containing protein [Fuerstiella sp.]
MPIAAWILLMAAALISSVTELPAQENAAPAQPDAASADTKENQKDWKPLFSGKDLKDWKVTNFGGEGEVEVGPRGELIIHRGVDLSGITSRRKDLPTTNYEVEFEAQRAKGTDFFVGYTFPVGDSACSLVLGGWGGGVCGISSLDFMDASDNETTSYRDFTRGKWYKVRVRVTDSHVKAWLGKWNIADVERALYKIDVRFEMEISKPMGFATYQTVAKVRNARIRTLSADEVDADD